MAIGGAVGPDHLESRASRLTRSAVLGPSGGTRVAGLGRAAAAALEERDLPSARSLLAALESSTAATATEQVTVLGARIMLADGGLVEWRPTAARGGLFAASLQMARGSAAPGRSEQGVGRCGPGRRRAHADHASPGPVDGRRPGPVPTRRVDLRRGPGGGRAVYAGRAGLSQGRREGRPEAKGPRRPKRVHLLGRGPPLCRSQ